MKFIFKNQKGFLSWFLSSLTTFFYNILPLLLQLSHRPFTPSHPHPSPNYFSSSTPPPFIPKSFSPISTPCFYSCSSYPPLNPTQIYLSSPLLLALSFPSTPPHLFSHVPYNPWPLLLISLLFPLLFSLSTLFSFSSQFSLSFQLSTLSLMYTIPFSAFIAKVVLRRIAEILNIQMSEIFSGKIKLFLINISFIWMLRTSDTYMKETQLIFKN